MPQRRTPKERRNRDRNDGERRSHAGVRQQRFDHARHVFPPFFGGGSSSIRRKASRSALESFTLSAKCVSSGASDPSHRRSATSSNSWRISFSLATTARNRCGETSELRTTQSFAVSRSRSF